MRDYRDGRGTDVVASSRTDAKVEFRVGRIIGNSQAAERGLLPDTRDRERKSRLYNADDLTAQTGTASAPRARVIRLPRVIVASVAP